MARAFQGTYVNTADAAHRQRFSARRDYVWDHGSFWWSPHPDMPIPLAVALGSGIAGGVSSAGVRLLSRTPPPATNIFGGVSRGANAWAWRYRGARMLGRTAGFFRTANPIMWKAMAAYWVARGSYYVALHSKRFHHVMGTAFTGMPLNEIWMDRSNRSRALAAIQSSHMSARTYIGNEASLMNR